MLKSYKTCWLQSRGSLTQPIEIKSSIPSFKYQDRALSQPSLRNSPERKIWNEKSLYCWFLFLRSWKKSMRKKKHTIEKLTLENMKKERLWSSVLLIGSRAGTEFGGFCCRTWVSREGSRRVLSFTFFNWALFKKLTQFFSTLREYLWKSSESIFDSLARFPPGAS